VKNGDDVDDNEYESSEKLIEQDGPAISNYDKLNEEVPGRNLSRNEVYYFDELKRILDHESQYFDFGDAEESLYLIVMKIFSLYVEGI
jgi:hypothetical protein